MLFSNIAVLLDDGTAENMYVGVKNGKISVVSATKPEGDFAREYDGRGKMLMPGLANTHTHVPMTLLRGFAEDLELEAWLKTKIFPMEAKLSVEDTYWGSLLGIAEMLKNGITSFTDMYVICDAVAQSVLETGIKCNFSFGITDLDGKGAKENGQLDVVKRLYSDFGSVSDRLKMDVGLHAVYSTSPKAVNEGIDFAASNGLNLHIHLSETQKELKDCIERFSMTPTRYFYEQGAFEVPTNAAHCVTVSDEDIQILADNGVSVSHCPASNLKLGSGIAPIVKMLERGVNVTIGTDGSASNNRLDIIRDASLAAMLQKGANNAPSVMNVSSVMRMISENGYKSQGRTPVKIKAGSDADLAVADLKKMGLRACASDLLYASDPSNICLTMVNGKVLYENGEYFTLDIEHIIRETEMICRKFR